MTILLAFLIVGLLGAALGIGLAFASKALAVTKDKKIEDLETALPGLNCGACGFAGCASYAEAVASESAELTLCSPGGPDTATKLGEIMGVEVDVSITKRVAQVHCRGGQDVSEYAFHYDGLEDCNALFLLYGGDKICKTGCLNLGSCIRVCPVDAIDYDAEGKTWVDKDICISCGKCLEICPTGVMKWVPYEADYIVACNNTDPPKLVRKHCKVGCIACKICEKKAPEGGFSIENNLSAINYAESGVRAADRAVAAVKCPPSCIIPVTQISQEETEEPADSATSPAAEPVAVGARVADKPAQAHSTADTVAAPSGDVPPQPEAAAGSPEAGVVSPDAGPSTPAPPPDTAQPETSGEPEPVSAEELAALEVAPRHAASETSDAGEQPKPGEPDDSARSSPPARDGDGGA